MDNHWIIGYMPSNFPPCRCFSLLVHLPATVPQNSWKSHNNQCQEHPTLLCVCVWERERNLVTGRVIWFWGLRSTTAACLVAKFPISLKTRLFLPSACTIFCFPPPTDLPNPITQEIQRKPSPNKNRIFKLMTTIKKGLIMISLKSTMSRTHKTVAFIFKKREFPYSITSNANFNK